MSREASQLPPEIAAQGERARGKLYRLLQKERGQMTREQYEQKLQELGELSPMAAYYKYLAKTRDYPRDAPFVGRERELRIIMGELVEK